MNVPRLVLDTNIVVSALIWGGEPRKLIRTATDGDIELDTSPVLLDELRDVLGRGHLAAQLNTTTARATDMSNKQLTETSKFLSYVLRHEPQAIALQLDREGWADVHALISAATQHGHRLDLALLEEVVATSEKKRFALSDDGTRIRAVQGHSTDSVDISFVEKVPPAVLYHGTASRFVESIRVQGLLPGERQYVHLSEDVNTAVSVGQRYGKPVVLTVAAGAMHEQGFKFFQAQNGVWLACHVPPAFLATPT